MPIAPHTSYIPTRYCKQSGDKGPTLHANVTLPQMGLKCLQTFVIFWSLELTLLDTKRLLSVVDNLMVNCQSSLQYYSQHNQIIEYSKPFQNTQISRANIL